MAQIDFDQWCELARVRPEQYFRERERVIGHFIADHPPAQAERLRELQARIDHARAIAGTPLRAARLMLSMMEDNLEVLQMRLVCLQRETDRIALLIRNARGLN